MAVNQIELVVKRFRSALVSVIFGMNRRCRRRTAADATVSPLTTAVRTGIQLPEEPVVE
ncbi:hypothetical protein HLRTI_003400 [Halorhabdus tiamatea SARL4B]|uniref:Uncharacterized protein n=1 Tax=Halorhabdus tiamatea SARL4B TaxID=1033806 RepID=U2F7W6_9EURY|nr:hypothetical protein HLRTI_003400 [Halorhabdus tiamatea SARL4B]